MAELSVSDSVTVSDLISQEQPVLNSAAAGNETTAVPPPQNTNELEEKKKRLLEELESALVSTPIPKPVHKPNRLGLGIEVIDETALLDSIPKIGKQSRRRASKKIHKKAVTVTETESESSIHLVARNISSSSSSSENERKYSREEMEAVRFVNVSQQRKFWKKIYDALQSTFSGEYDALVAAPNNPPPFVPNKKPILIEECIEDDDSEDDYASIQRPAFQVDGEPNFDSGPPEDGWEYLRRVRWEAQQFPNVKISKLDRSKLTKEQSPYMPQIPDIAKCPEHLLPLKQWEDAFLAEFSALRVNLSCLVEERSSTMLSGSNFGDILLCNNKSIAKADQPTNLAGKHEDNITSLENPGLKTSKDQTCSNIPTPPLLSTILGMDSVARVSMLLKRIRLLEPENTITRIDCLWLFALCAAVDTPLDADTCAALRSLLRKCADIRAGKAELDDEVVMLNILATISGRYFGQSEN
ncbi:uncharacterized protein LOC131645754 [Vicia villosa]|uniref:uncharacterized protein LOC131645754 n=1 Tax=Vicia villosa TaxID=3911 RepID=UPI00273ACE15|nr:uncharacterized protein LOC131645754 [Vicia villosa]